MKDEKKKLRKNILDQIKNMDIKEKNIYDQVIFQNVVNMREYQQATVIFIFVSTEHEINTKPIIEDAIRKNKIVGVPKCVSKGIMEVYEIKSYDELDIGSYGIMEPRSNCRLINKDEINFAVIPCVTCDRNGYRLGYGGGYYDRYLEKSNFKKAVICYEKVIQESVPTDIYDIKCNYVVTNKDVYEIK